MNDQLYRLSKSKGNMVYLVFHDDGTEEVTRGVLVPVTVDYEAAAKAYQANGGYLDREALVAAIDAAVKGET